VGTSPDIEEYDDANRCHGRRAPGALGLSRPLKTEGVDLSRAPPANSGRRRWPVNSDDILVVIVYSDESRAQTAHERLAALTVESLIEVEVAASLTKDMRGRIKQHQSRGQMGMRARFGRHNHPDDMDRTLQEIADSLDPGAAALCLLVRSVTPEKVVPELSKYGGAILKTSLPPDREQLLKDAFAQQLSAQEISAELNH